MMKRLRMLLLFWTIVSLTAIAQNTIPPYDLKSYGTGVEGTYSAEIFVYLSKPNKNVEKSLRMASIHGVIFKGLTAGKREHTQRPMAGASTEKEHADFFTSFFADESQYSRYVDIVDGSLRVEKAEKKLYRIRAIVSIQKDALRAYLEKEKIIESFNNLF